MNKVRQNVWTRSLVWMLSVVYRTVRILYHQSQVAALFLVSLFAIFNYAPGFYPPRDSMLFYPTEPEEVHENKSPRIDVETTFYRQPQLLQEASARLLPERPGITDLYFLGFAGEADENVFSHEIRYARDLFDQRFDTKGRSMVLINHTETVANTPLANIHNLELALRRIAERMNLEEDMVFIFLSSHGSKDHQLSVEFWPFNLNDLAATTLKELLDRSRIRNRVIVISACYSGGFLDVLKDDYSLIMTAASRDRQSFGCGDTAVFTYFGEAYFVQALTREYSFIKAFYAAKRSIEQREANENKTPSLPQIHVGTAIAKKLEVFAGRRNTRTAANRP